MITIFANFRINDEERFQNLQKSFFSFYKSNINNWIINIRGNKKDEVCKFLEKNILQKFKITHLESKEGWFNDSKELCNQELSDYIFCWNEDHINMVNEEKFNNYIQQIIDNKIDHFIYSWFHFGDLPKSFEINATKKKDYLYIIDYNYYNHKNRLKLIKDKKYYTQEYIISLQGIFKKELFLKILNTDDPLLKRWNKKTPFDFEKTPYDIHWLPFQYACPKEEFFACIDDDAGQKNYCINNRSKKVIINNINNRFKFKDKKIIIYILKLFRYPIFKFWIFIREIINKRNAINKFQQKI